MRSLLRPLFLVLGYYAATQVIPSPQAGADAWSTGVAGGQTKYVHGVQTTQADQAGLAVQAQGRMLANFTSVVSSGEWARRLQAVGTTGWRDATVAKAGNYGAAAQTGKGKYLNAAQQLYPYEANLQSQVKALKAQGASPLQRFTTWMDGMIAFKQQYTP